MTMGFTGTEKPVAGLPTNIAIACSNCARAIATLVAPACALCSAVSASTTDICIGDAGLILRLGQFEFLLVGRHGIVKELLQLILSANFEKEICQGCLLRQPFVFQIGRADLSRVPSLAHRITDLAPQVGLPGRFERQ